MTDRTHARAVRRARRQAAEAARKRERFARDVEAGRRAARADARETFQRENLNRGKRHAARMMPAAENSGARTKNDPRVDLLSYSDGTPSLGATVTKNVPTVKTLRTRTAPQPQPYVPQPAQPRSPRKLPKPKPQTPQPKPDAPLNQLGRMLGDLRK